VNYIKHEKVGYWFDILLAISLGGLACLTVYGFEKILELSEYFNPERISKFWIIALPSLSGLVVGLISYLLKIKSTEPIFDTVAGANFKRRILAKPSSLLKPVLAAISIIGGNPVGSEKSVIMLGSTVAALAGRYLDIPHKRRHLLIGCGAAAGFASAFMSPLAGILFVIEVILMDYSPYSFSMLALSSGSAFLFSKVIGLKPLFVLPALLAPKTIYLFIFALLGVACSLLTFLWEKLTLFIENNRERIKHHKIFAPMIGGFVAGIICVFVPIIWGPGLSNINFALGSVQPVLFSLLVVGAKIIGTSFALGLGVAGGDLAPSVFIGAFIGAAFAPIASEYLPLFVVAGMCAQLSSAFHAPLTSILLAIEIAGGRIPNILPIVVATAISFLLSTKITPRSIFQEGLHRCNVPRKFGQLQNPLEIKIREIMLQNPLVIQKDEPVKQAIDLMREHNVTGLPVLDGEKLFGVITLTDLRRHVTSQDLEKPTSLFCSVDLVTISPATTISDSLTMMHENQVGRLLVVSPSNPKKLLGIVSKKDLLELATRRYAQIDE